MWAGPPDGIFGEMLPVRAVLVRSHALLVVVDHLICYPTGFEFSVAIRMRRTPAPDTPLMSGGPLMGPNAWQAGRAADTRMRLGVAFADGRKATNLDALPHPGPGVAGIAVSTSAAGASESRTAGDQLDDAQAPILVPRAGGGGGTRWDHTYWVWGLPPEGPLSLVVEWPAEHVAETRVDIDGGAIRQAAGRAEVLWAD